MHHGVSCTALRRASEMPCEAGVGAGHESTSGRRDSLRVVLDSAQRVDRGIGHRNADQVNQRQTESNREARESDGRAIVSGARCTWRSELTGGAIGARRALHPDGYRTRQNDHSKPRSGAMRSVRPLSPMLNRRLNVIRTGCATFAFRPMAPLFTQYDDVVKNRSGRVTEPAGPERVETRVDSCGEFSTR